MNIRQIALLFALAAAPFFLHTPLRAQGQKAPAMSDPKYGDAAAIRALPTAKLNAQIGRASCRERV